MNFAPNAVTKRLADRLFGAPILRNSIRGEIIEEIVAMAREPDWLLCAGDWASCDLRHSSSGFRIQVKQSAARQSWHTGSCGIPKPRFSIAEKTGRWENGDRWIEERSRNAEIFVFAWHPLTSASADHRNAHQWEFYVAAEPSLPRQKSISLDGIRRLASVVSVEKLRERVEEIASSLSRPPSP
ncbi:hypothetical protein [Allosphingosinicella vermicomposti]|uniref:hypothetical protein n=1 Tax=Allosphingosinicella vermicomposti TaxID=614671 RepID=UPI000D10EBEC|nr:hypothetical protein [Allosphingosinicella vermicomposti]